MMSRHFIVVTALLLFIAPTKAQRIYIGCTPADAHIRNALGIAQNSAIDFLRWNLSFPGPGKFVLNVTYGESQPNTLGFKNGGINASFEGIYKVRVPNGIPVYTLRFDNGRLLSFRTLSDQLLHILTADGRLMPGNGGWSYTLTKKVSGSDPSGANSMVNSRIRAFPDSVTMYEGRTPCQEISKEYGFGAPSECFKLKWLLTLNRDSSSTSGTFVLNRTLHRATLIKGKWKIDATGTIKLTPAKGQTFSLIAGDENVLFFTDKKGRLFKGDENFSYTLNRRKKKAA